MFWNRKASVPTLTNDGYSRWLRASRPPWAWFLRLSELEQEQLACIGDEFHRAKAQLVADAIATPQVHKQEDSEQQKDEELAKAMAVNLLRKIGTEARPKESPAYSFAETLAGSGNRRRAAQEQHAQEKASAQSLFGRHPDKVEP